MSFDEAAVDTLVDKVVSHAASLGVFRRVNSHEPKAAPGNGLTYAVWVDTIEPLGGASGLAAVSGYVVLTGRIYGNMLMKPEDEIDPRILKAASRLLAAYCGDFDFGATVRNVDLFGTYGQKLRTQAGYAKIASSVYRIKDVTIPVVINDMFLMEN